MSEPKNVNMCPRECSCEGLVNNSAATCPCLKKLLEAKVKGFILILLAEEISKQPKIDSVTWLLVVTLMKIYDEKEQAE